MFLGENWKFTGSAKTNAPLCTISPCYKVVKSTLSSKLSSNLIESGISMSFPSTSLLKGLPEKTNVYPSFTFLMKYSAFT
jgi:hypothetical protein